MATTKWESWCRLCGRIDGGNELKYNTVKNVLEILHKYFRIPISSSNDCISVVCQECLDLVLNVEKFSLRYAKVNQMFLKLAKGGICDDVLESVRETFGLSGSYEYIICEKSRLEAKIEPLLESEIDEPNLNGLFVVNDSESDCDYKPDDKRRRKEPEGNQPNSKKHKQNIKVKSTQSTARKCKSSIESKSDDIDLWCHLCDTTFKMHHTYLKHMREKHSPSVLLFVCAECPSKVFASKKNLLQHATYRHRPKAQRKRHPCPKCDKTFCTVDVVHLHVRTVHMGERPFVCEECGKTCATKGSLKEHKLSHTEERPIKCTECPKRFKDLTGLKRHFISHNTTPSFECMQCGQQLKTLQTLNNHMLVHSDETRYKCQHCGKEFKRNKAFKKHLILHTGLRPFACQFCDTTYADASNLRAHKKKNHPVELAALEEVTSSAVI